MSDMGCIKFLGTAGARFVMIKQLRSSGGIWLNYKSTDILIDPGPGCLVKCASSRPKLDPGKLDGIILTHKHLDHSGDLNVMIEAMTEGGFKKRGVLFLPSDALGPDGVIFSYLKDFPKQVVLLEKKSFSLRDIDFEVPVKNAHSVETYGLKFRLGNHVVSFLSDTKYFDGLAKVYKGSTVLVVNVVFFTPRGDYDHLSLEEAIEIVKKVNPQKAFFTHFGMSVLREKPHILEEKVRKESGMDIKFAYDGMKVDVPI